MKLPSQSTHTKRWALALVALLLPAVSHAGHHANMAQTTGKALGVTISEVPFEALEASNLDHGVRVVGVMPGTPAAAAGLRIDDVIVALNEKPVYSVSRLQWLVRQAPEGSPVPVKFRRQDGLETVTVTFEPAPQAERKSLRHPHPKHPGMSSHPAMQAAPHVPRAYLGVQFQPMTEPLRAAFGAPTDKGVLVVGVAEDGPAQQAGFAVGDIIVRMDRRHISKMSDVYRVLAYFDPAEEIEVEVIREKESRTIKARLGTVPLSMSSLPRYEQPHGHP